MSADHGVRADLDRLLAQTSKRVAPREVPSVGQHVELAHDLGVPPVVAQLGERRLRIHVRQRPPRRRRGVQRAADEDLSGVERGQVLPAGLDHAGAHHLRQRRRTQAVQEGELVHRQPAREHLSKLPFPAMSVIVAVPLLVLFIVIVGKLTGRLLGIRLGNWRGALVGLVGWFGGLLAAAYTIGEPTKDGGRVLEAHTFGQWLQSVAVVIVFGVLTAMPVAIGMDLLTRSARTRPRSSRARLRFLHPIRAIRASLAPYGRLRELIANARQANLLHFRYASKAALESPDFAKRLRLVLEESGGMLVKLGQIASTRTDVLPDALTDELSNLQSDVRPVPEADVRAVVEKSLDEPVEHAFGSFETQPLAAASIGQTHRAVLLDGTRVVVKVQRPGIDQVVARDAAVLRLAAARLERHVDAAREVGLSSFSEELIAGLEEELDYQHEAVVGRQLRENRAGDVGISVPSVYSTLSTDRVLVMEEVVGRSIADQQAIDASPVVRSELARRLLSSFLGPGARQRAVSRRPAPGQPADRRPGHNLDARLRIRRATRRASARRAQGDRPRRRHERRQRAGAGRAGPVGQPDDRSPRAGGRSRRAAVRARRRWARPPRDRRGSIGDAAPRDAPACIDHAAGARAVHARGDDQDPRPRVQPGHTEPRDRHARTPRGVRHASNRSSSASCFAPSRRCARCPSTPKRSPTNSAPDASRYATNSSPALIATPSTRGSTGS